MNESTLQPKLDELQPQVGAVRHSGGKDAADHRLERTQRFRALAERSPILVRIMDGVTRCRWANRAWLEFTGRSRKELLGEGWLRQLHAGDRERYSSTCREAFESNRLCRVEYRLQRKRGSYEWMVEIGSPRLDTRGGIGGFFGVATEIGEHRRAETHLEVQYALADILAQARTLEDAGTQILERLCARLGWDLGELWLVDDQRKTPHCRRLWAFPSFDLSDLERQAQTREFPQGAGPSWRSGSAVWIRDIRADERLAREPEAQRLGLRGMVRLPIAVHGEIRAVLRLFCREAREQDDAMLEFLQSVGLQIGQSLERQEALERIRTSEARKAAILEASLDAVITIDLQGRVVEFNTAAEAIFGCPRSEVLGRDVSALLIPPRLRAQAMAGLASYQATGESGLLGKRFDTVAIRADGSEFPIEVALTPIAMENPPLITIYVRDATARRSAEQAVAEYQGRLRSLAADLLLAEEHERRRLAADLHDGLSQTITLARLKLSALRTSLNGAPATALDEITGLIENADHDARSLSFELSPPVLHDLGLEPALQWLVENIQARYGIEIVLEDDGPPRRADEKTRVILFRSIRELLINAAKHAQARRVHVCLRRGEDQLDASVEDDGVGMAPERVKATGFGLFSIHERLSHVGGSMRIESAPGRGTKVQLRAPLTNKEPVKERIES